MAIQKVGVVGCGLMGSGIVQVCAAAGFETVVREVAPELVEYVDPPGGTLRSLLTRAKNAVMRSREEPAPKKELRLRPSH